MVTFIVTQEKISCRISMVVQTLCFPCKECGFNPIVEIPQCGEKKIKKNTF